MACCCIIAGTGVYTDLICGDDPKSFIGAEFDANRRPTSHSISGMTFDFGGERICCHNGCATRFICCWSFVGGSCHRDRILLELAFTDVFDCFSNVVSVCIDI